jgi:hypothetical protein
LSGRFSMVRPACTSPLPCPSQSAAWRFKLRFPSSAARFRAGKRGAPSDPRRAPRSRRWLREIPASNTLMVCVAGGSRGAQYSPEPVLSLVRTAAAAVLEMVTVPPGAAAPVGFVMVPKISPVAPPSRTGKASVADQQRGYKRPGFYGSGPRKPLSFRRQFRSLTQISRTIHAAFSGITAQTLRLPRLRARPGLPLPVDTDIRWEMKRDLSSRWEGSRFGIAAAGGTPRGLLPAGKLPRRPCDLRPSP